MKKLLAASVLAMAFMASSAQAVTTISFNGGSGTLPTGTTVFQNFDSIPAGTMVGNNAFTFSQTQNFQAVRPAFGSTGNFLAVMTNGTYSVNFGPVNLFSFVLGSLDTFNQLTLRYEDGSSSVLTGGAIVGDTTLDNPGSRTDAEVNGVVSYNVTSGPRITGATFGSLGGNAFEVDNLSAGAVPEPAAWGMMILGFGLVGGAMRRRQSVKVKFA